MPAMKTAITFYMLLIAPIMEQMNTNVTVQGHQKRPAATIPELFSISLIPTTS